MEEPKSSRNWAFTSFNLDQNYPLQGRFTISYMVVGLEKCPETGRMHHQGFIQMKHKVLRKSLLAALPGVGQLKPCFASAKQNDKYCRKDGNIVYEEGSLVSQGERMDLEQIKEDILAGKSKEEIAAENFSANCFHQRAFENFRQMMEPKRCWPTKVVYLWGDADSGKSAWCKQQGAKEVQFIRGFIAGYNGEDKVFFDDVDTNTFNGERSLLLKLMDRYEFEVNVKFGSRNWKPKEMYITSNFPPEITFAPIGWDAALKRRIDYVYHVINEEDHVTKEPVFEDLKMSTQK